MLIVSPTSDIGTDTQGWNRLRPCNCLSFLSANEAIALCFPWISRGCLWQPLVGHQFNPRNAHWLAHVHCKVGLDDLAIMKNFWSFLPAIPKYNKSKIDTFYKSYTSTILQEICAQKKTGAARQLVFLETKWCTKLRSMFTSKWMTNHSKATVVLEYQRSTNTSSPGCPTPRRTKSNGSIGYNDTEWKLDKTSEKYRFWFCNC